MKLKHKLMLGLAAVVIVILMVASAAKTLKLLTWLLAFIGAYAIYRTLKNKAHNSKRKPS
ncbi:hypothetical protein TW86_04155 [Halomonas sp. S2151]|uniref:hypothetical protein n=1 Tax=Halomonas sp. S2151 TaxID=579478 RepID=UPI00061F9F2A|nr:hypothetical protein [Halomonas sp. S2151]KJZ17451.1 hypothetical protein TW86_04155 [Halomonas sp. S2151]